MLFGFFRGWLIRYLIWRISWWSTVSYIIQWMNILRLVYHELYWSFIIRNIWVTIQSLSYAYLVWNKICNPCILDRPVLECGLRNKEIGLDSTLLHYNLFRGCTIWSILRLMADEWRCFHLFSNSIDYHSRLLHKIRNCGDIWALEKKELD